MNNNTKMGNKGFTLVELIVVLVILAILAAILVPALLGYIEDARDKQNYLDAKSVLNAVQSELAKRYARYSDTLDVDNEFVIYEDDNKTKLCDGDGKGTGDVNAINSSFAAKILELSDLTEEPPWLLIIGVGSNWLKKTSASDNEAIKAQNEMSLHDRYTVYYLLYFKDKNSKPIYYFNGEWTDINPRAGENSATVSKYNVFKKGPLKGKRIQYYFLSFNTSQANYQFGNSNLWESLKDNGGRNIYSIFK